MKEPIDLLENGVWTDVGEQGGVRRQGSERDSVHDATDPTTGDHIQALQSELAKKIAESLPRRP